MTTRLEALRIERDMLAGLVAAAPRGRPEIVSRLRLVTTELLRLELTPLPLQAVPEFADDEGQPLRYFQK